MPMIQKSDLEWDEARGRGYKTMTVLSLEGRSGRREDGKHVTPSIGVRLESDDGKHAFANLWLSVKAWPSTAEKLEKIFGFTGAFKDLPLWLSYNQPTEEVRVRASFKEEEYQGKVNLKCEGFFSDGEGLAKPIDPQEWNDLAAMIGDGPVSVSAVTAQPAKETPPIREVGKDDDLPF